MSEQRANGFRRPSTGAIALLALFAAVPATAQDYEVGRSGWQLERLSDSFVLLRSEIFSTGKRSTREGLVIIICDGQARRMRFQIGETPGSPSTRPTAVGRAIIRAVHPSPKPALKPVFASVRYFDDGSFELHEAGTFNNATMRDLLSLLLKLPSRLELVLFKGEMTGAFLRGTPMQFELVGLAENLAQIYGFEGLCYRARS